MPDHQGGRNNRPGGLPGGLVSLVDGVGYSLEVLLHYDIGERRCREMGGSLLIAMGTLALASLFVNAAAQSKSASNSAAKRQVDSFYYPDGVYGYQQKPTQAGTPRKTANIDFGLFAPYIFCVFVVGFHVHHRLRARQRRREGGEPTHSHYSGRPDMLKRLRRFFPGLSELTCKRYLEPLEVFLGGLVLLVINPLLGVYWMLAAVIIAFTVNTRLHHERELVLDSNDGMIDMLTHQENIVAERNPQPQQPVSARAVVAGPVPQTVPAPERPRERARTAPERPPEGPKPKPTTPAPIAVPSALCDGLNANLLDLLQEQHHEQ